MTESHFSAPRPDSPPSEIDAPREKRIRALWRWFAAIAAVAILFLEYVGYEAARSINGYYFKDSSAPVGAADIFWVALAIYLLLAAVFGRWLLFRRVS
jgi:hypothetical protein